MRIEVIVRKGNDVAKFTAPTSQVASQVGRGWADRGYAVTVVCYPLK